VDTPDQWGSGTASAPAAALLAFDYALTPLFAPSLRGGMPEEERKVVERTKRAVRHHGIPRCAHHVLDVFGRGCDPLLRIASRMTAKASCPTGSLGVM
jgi:hypothetical protein